MPNPLTKVSGTAYVTLGAPAFGHQPELSQEIALVLTAGTHLEAELARSLAFFMDSDVRIAIAVNDGFKSARVQRSMLLDCGNAVLALRYRKLFRAVLAVAGRVADRRNDVVHGIWGYSTNLPGCVLWIDQKDYLVHRLNRDVLAGWSVPFQPRSRVWVYRPGELRKLYLEICDAGAAFVFFWAMIRARPGARAHWRRRLLALPAIDREYRKLVGGKRRKPRKRRRAPKQIASQK